MTSSTSPMQWQSMAAPPSLREGEVHLWRVPIASAERALERLYAALVPEERARAERSVDGGSRRRFVVGRGALRLLLAGYLERAPGSIRLSYSSRGRPGLEGGGIDFSVSHSGDLVLAAFTAGGPVGVDVEWPGRAVDVDRIARRVFDEATRRVLAAVPAAERHDAFLRAWTQREAYVKAVGGALLATRVPLPFAWPTRPGAVAWGAGAERWTVLTLDAAMSCPAAVVVRGGVDRFRLLEPAALDREG